MGDDDILGSSFAVLVVCFLVSVLKPLQLFHGSAEIVQRCVPVRLSHGACIVHAGGGGVVLGSYLLSVECEYLRSSGDGDVPDVGGQLWLPS